MSEVQAALDRIEAGLAGLELPPTPVGWPSRAELMRAVGFVLNMSVQRGDAGDVAGRLAMKCGWLGADAVCRAHAGWLRVVGGADAED